jgi:26S proteasome regulatory subunit T2
LEQSKRTEEEEEQLVKDSRAGCRASNTGDRKGDANNKKEKKYDPAAPSTRGSRRDPKYPLACLWFTPATKCKLWLLKLDCVKDYLLMEEEFVAGQERLKPHENKKEEDRSKVDDLRGSLI